MWQGSESPLDDAWLGQYRIHPEDPVRLEAFRKIVGTDLWENRRPNDLQTFPYTGERLYIGQEGALSILEGDTARFVFKSDSGTNFPYSYITAIWVDPQNPRHLLFGGKQNGGEEMNLYETFDEGGHIARFTDKMGFAEPDIREIVATQSFPAVVVSDAVLQRVSLYLYQSGPVDG